MNKTSSKRYVLDLMVVLLLTLPGAVSIRAEVPEKWKQLAEDVEAVGGRIEFAAGEPIAMDLYNGNNPLKGRGGRNEAVNDQWLERIAGLESLKKLSLSNCAVTDDGMVHVGTLLALEDLNLTLTEVTDQGFIHFKGLTKLRALGLASSKCSGEGFKYLSVTDLESINFHFTPLNDAGLEAICDVGVKGRFWFAHTHFTNAGATHLSKLTQLKVLGIGSAEKESSGESVAFITNLPLVDLSLLDQQADDVGFRFAAKIATLTKLDAGHAPDLSDEGLSSIASMPALKELRVGGATKVSDQGVQQLAECRSLKKLTLQRLRGVTDAGIEKLRMARPDIEIVVK